MTSEQLEVPYTGGDDAVFEAAVREAVLSALRAPELVQVDALGPAERADLVVHLRQLHSVLTRALHAVAD